MPGQRTSVRDAIASLRSAQKSNSGAPAYSRFINRPLGRVFAAVAHQLGVTPNQVTGLSALSTFSGIALIALVRPTWVSVIAVVVLLVLGYALDSADGQLARLRGGGSPQGEWLDHTVDSIKMGMIHLAVLICWWRFYDVDAVFLLIPIVYQVVASVFFFSLILADLLRRVDASTMTKSTSSFRVSPIYALLALPSDYGLLLIVFLLLPWPWLFIPVYGLLLVANIVILAASLIRWYRSFTPTSAPAS